MSSSWHHSSMGQMLDGMLYLPPHIFPSCFSFPPPPSPIPHSFHPPSSPPTLCFFFPLSLLLSCLLCVFIAKKHKYKNNGLDCFPAALQPSFLVYILLHHSHSLQLHWSCPHSSGTVLLDTGNSNCWEEQHWGTKVHNIEKLCISTVDALINAPL